MNVQQICCDMFQLKFWNSKTNQIQFQKTIAAKAKALEVLRGPPQPGSSSSSRSCFEECGGPWRASAYKFELLLTKGKPFLTRDAEQPEPTYCITEVEQQKFEWGNPERALLHKGCRTTRANLLHNRSRTTNSS